MSVDFCFLIKKDVEGLLIEEDSSCSICLEKIDKNSKQIIGHPPSDWCHFECFEQNVQFGDKDRCLACRRFWWNLDEYFPDGKTPEERALLLKTAIQIGSSEAVQRILDIGLPISQKAKEEAFITAAANGDRQTLQRLDSLAEFPFETLRDAFMQAAFGGHRGVLEYLRSKYREPLAGAEEAAFAVCLKGGHVEIAKEIACVQEISGSTKIFALLHSAEAGQLESALYLKSFPEISEQTISQAFYRAAESGRDLIIRALSSEVSEDVLLFGFEKAIERDQVGVADVFLHALRLCERPQQLEELLLFSAQNNGPKMLAKLLDSHPEIRDPLKERLAREICDWENPDLSLLSLLFPTPSEMPKNLRTASLRLAAQDADFSYFKKFREGMEISEAEIFEIFAACGYFERIEGVFPDFKDRFPAKVLQNALFKAVEEQHAHTVALLVEKFSFSHAAIEAAFRYSVSCNAINIAEVLIPSVCASKKLQEVSILIAVNARMFDAVNLLVRSGIVPTETVRLNVFNVALSNEDWEILELLLADRDNISDTYIRYFFSKAIDAGDLAIEKLCLWGFSIPRGLEARIVPWAIRTRNLALLEQQFLAASAQTQQMGIFQTISQKDLEAFRLIAPKFVFADDFRGHMLALAIRNQDLPMIQELLPIGLPVSNLLENLQESLSKTTTPPEIREWIQRRLSI